MSGYLNALKNNGVTTLKNFVMDASLLSAANWVGDRYVASIVSISSPIAGATTSLVVNGVDLLGKVISTRYSNNDYLGSALRVALTSASLVGSGALIPNLAGRVGIEISREVMLRYTAAAALVLFLKNTVSFVGNKFRFSEANINYQKLTIDDVKYSQKYSDDQIVKMATFVKENGKLKISSDVAYALRDRARRIKKKPENIDYKTLTLAQLSKFDDNEIRDIAYFLNSQNSLLSKEKRKGLNEDVHQKIDERAQHEEAEKINPMNIDYASLTSQDLEEYSHAEIFDIVAFLARNTSLSQAKVKELKDDVLAELLKEFKKSAEVVLKSINENKLADKPENDID